MFFSSNKDLRNLVCIFVSMIQSKPYVAINASAGSGKTYSLVQKILIICLSQPHQHDAIKNILALTFTNKAANEMKERILSWLKSFTQNDYEKNNELLGIQDKLKELGVPVSTHDLHYRAQKVLDFILHHYSTLNISTIDKFNSKLVRSFSYELGLPHQFNLEINNEPYLIEAIDRLLQQIGEDGKISEAFLDLVNYNLENDEKVSINKTLYSRAKKYINDAHYSELKKNNQYDWETYESLKKQLRTQIEQSKTKRLQLANDALELIKQNGLEEKHFAGKSNGIANFFKKYIETVQQNKDFPFPTTSEEKKLEAYRKGASPDGKPFESIVENLVEPLIKIRSEMISEYISQVKYEKILKELLPFKFNKEIQDLLHIIESENDLVLLSKFNVLINENLKDEPSNFIYEKIGTKFQHFFIDEFQDTSQMQWDNLLPLRDNSIHTENNTFTIVGDPKQSIYSFRGGDSEIMMNILHQKENVFIPISIENLENNWRSSQNIVQFNNDLYDFFGKQLLEQHEILFAVNGKQTARKKDLGRVKIGLTDYSRSTVEYYDNAAEQMFRNIQECLDNGYQLSDITIICRTGKEIKNFAQRLTQNQVFYKGQDQYIKTISDKGLTLDLSDTLQALTSYLKWELEEQNLQHVVKLLYHLNQLGKIQLEDFTAEVQEIIAPKSKIEIEKNIELKFGLQLFQQNTPKLNLYNYIEYFINTLSVDGKETDFILNFMELLFNFTQNPGVTLKSFIKYWDEEISSISVQASHHIDAVNLMTIHAAKGLEFPIVFIPFFSGNNDGKFSNWMNLEGFENLKSINLDSFSKNLGVYDQQIEEFNLINTYKNTIDRLCVYYVATTRAVDQLFLYLQKPADKKEGGELEIYEFIKNNFNVEEAEFDLYPEENNSFKKKITKEQESEHPTLHIENITVEQKKKKNIKIATPSKNYQNTVSKVRKGIFTHEILAKIKTKKDVQPVLERYLLEGTITKEEKTEIENKINTIIDQYQDYFEEGLTILSEKDMMISLENETLQYRPDRMIIKPEGIIVIDYKTGDEKSKDQHQEQIELYKKLIESLGKKVLKTEIIYTS